MRLLRALADIIEMRHVDGMPQSKALTLCNFITSIAILGVPGAALGQDIEKPSQSAANVQSNTPAPLAPAGSPAIPRGEGAWFQQGAYPSRALRRGEEGTVGFQAIITPEGHVARCIITASSGSVDLDAATCAMVERYARFEPATDSAGNDTTGTYANQMVWIIPD